MNITNELKDKYQFLIDEGYTTKQIANELKMCWSTVKGHLRKLQMKTIHKIEPYAITKEQLKQLIEKNYSTYDIAKELKCSQCVIKNRLKLFELKSHSIWSTLRIQTKKEIEEGYKTCPQCHRKKSLIAENFYLKNNGKFHYWCKECNDRITYQKQFNRKKQCVEYLGKKCFICGYDKYLGALDFHHIDPTQKKFNISKLKTYSWNVLKIELNKCICVCRNCHAEIHFGLHDDKLVGLVGIVPTSYRL